MTKEFVPDEELVAIAASGDASALEELIGRYKISSGQGQGHIFWQVQTVMTSYKRV